MLAELDERGTIAAVADALHLTAPGISMQLAALERDVGVQLTERHGRRILVTPAGRVLARHARDIGDLLAVAEMEASALREGSRGTYRIGAFPTAARSYVAEAWRALAEAAEPAKPTKRAEPAEPGIQLRLTESEPSISLPALAAGEVELAVTHSYSNMPPLTSEGLISTPLGSEHVVLALRSDDRMLGGTEPDATATSAAPTPATAPAPVDLAAFARHDWVLPHREWSCREMVERACGIAGFEPRAVAWATDFSVQLSLVASVGAVALIPRLGVAALPPGVVIRELDTPVLRHHFAVIRRAASADRGLRRVRTQLERTASTRLEPVGFQPMGDSE
ncbi:hypothetical protein B7R21_14995 [Subtercola boreus]|uniref:HTH lysR-type domain-containing protein n=2 Tax=Subtercola boreus TaxID=120213 RepID=A0A3E0VCV9_9MICO|nr:hypothetical protein B7R21_14995 [Subtercola boreus]